jgi:hypothetical protein
MSGRKAGTSFKPRSRRLPVGVASAAVPAKAARRRSRARKGDRDPQYGSSSLAPTTADDTFVFICWSGPRSLVLAERFRKFLVAVIPALNRRIFFSPQIEKGARWFEEVLRHLDAAQVGVICLTSENLSAPWLHFEAGALLKGLHKTPGTADDAGAAADATQARVFTYLHDVNAAALSGPLAQYQSTSTTRADTRNLVRTISRRLDPDSSAYRQAFDAHWPAFDRDLKRLRVNLPELLPEFERWFRRKTFDEPLHECTDQNWLGRYDGARQTWHRLTEHVRTVRLACPRYQADLYERLVALVEAYAMDVRALLVRAPTFELGRSGEVLIQPEGVLKACESRRGKIKEVVSRVLDPMAVPTTDESARFWLSDSFDVRKMLVHRCEHSVRSVQDDGRHAIEIPSEAEARELFESLWDLDRIFGYLVFEYQHHESPRAAQTLHHAVTAEVERFRAGLGTSMMPLYYAIRSLKASLDRQTPLAISIADAIRSTLDELRQHIEESKPGPDAEPLIDRGGQLRRVMAEVASALPHRRTPAAKVRPTTRKKSSQRARRPA